jgi:hypothetical protein
VGLGVNRISMDTTLCIPPYKSISYPLAVTVFR